MTLQQLYLLPNFKKYTSLSVLLLFFLPILFTCTNKNQNFNLIYHYGLFDQYEDLTSLENVWEKQGDIQWMEEKGDCYVRIINESSKTAFFKSSLQLDSTWRRIKISGNVRIPKLAPLPQFGKTARLYTAFYSDEGDLLSFTGDISSNHVTWRNPIEDWTPFEFSFNLPLYVDEGDSKGQNKMDFQFEINEAAGVLDINDFRVEVVEEKQIVDGAYFNKQILANLESREIHGAQLNPETEASINYFLYVSPDDVVADDDNEGTEKLPLKTLGKALTIAQAKNQPCKIILDAGKYHEENTIVSTQNNKAQPLLIIEAKQKGETIITGAEKFTDWQPTSKANIYEHIWEHNFGVSEQIWAGNGPWGNAGFIGEKGLRKEMLFVNNQPYLQVFTKEKLATKTFFIDESNQKVFIKLPANKQTENLQIELATKGSLLNVNNRENLILRNLVFEKAAKFIPFGSVEFSYCKNILIENCDFLYSNATGLLFNFAENITLKNVRASHNGWNGYKFEYAEQIIAENCETSYNNWRGNIAGINGWDLAGNKNFNVHHFLIDGHKAYDNRGEGIWFDWCCHNIRVENTEIINNHSSGIYWEASQGPVMIKNCRITHNGNSGIQNAEAWNMALLNNQIYDNYASQLEIRARLRSGEDRFSTPNYQFTSLYLTTQNNAFSSEIPASHLVELYSMRDSSIAIYQALLNSYNGSGNTFYHAKHDTVFSFERHHYTNTTKYDRIKRGGRKKLESWVNMTSEYHPVWKDTILPRISIAGITNGQTLQKDKNHAFNIIPNLDLDSVYVGYVRLKEGKDIHKYFNSDFISIPLKGDTYNLNMGAIGDYAIMSYGFTSKGSLVVSPKIKIKVKAGVSL